MYSPLSRIHYHLPQSATKWARTTVLSQFLLLAGWTIWDELLDPPAPLPFPEDYDCYPCNTFQKKLWFLVYFTLTWNHFLGNYRWLEIKILIKEDIICILHILNALIFTSHPFSSQSCSSSLTFFPLCSWGCSSHLRSSAIKSPPRKTAHLASIFLAMSHSSWAWFLAYAHSPSSSLGETVWPCWCWGWSTALPWIQSRQAPFAFLLSEGEPPLPIAESAPKTLPIELEVLQWTQWVISELSVSWSSGIGFTV